MSAYPFISGLPLMLARALRVTQWTKNGIVFAAFVFAWGDPEQGITGAHIIYVLPAALLFCLVSSGIYLINDVKDREYDRAHPTKRLRPVASGQLPVRAALMLSAGLLIAGLAAGWLLSTSFFAVLCAYVGLQIVYTFGLKEIALVDVFVIAGGFVLRALAGAVVIDVTISPWLLLCTLLLALFLALCKRRHEKVVLSDVANATRSSMVKYDAQLLDQLIAIVSAATIVSYAIYTLWPDTVEKFGTANLGFTIPFVIFGLFRYLDLVYRHEQGGRPERILLTDKPLLIDIGLYGLTVLAIMLLR